MVRLVGDFGVFEGPVLLAASGNTRSYGGGMHITPQAVWDDGLLDICIVRPISRLTVLRLFLRVFSGSHVRYSPVRIERTRSLSIESEAPLWIYADGEPICQTPATIEVVPGALRVQVGGEG